MVGSQVIVTVLEVQDLPNGGTFELTLSGIKNSFSLKTTDGFSGINVVSETNFMISDFPTATAGITNKYPAELVVYSADPDDNSFD